MMIDFNTAIGLVCVVISAASAFCASTPTPDPSTTWGKLYRIIEFLAILVGKAKDDGLIEKGKNESKSAG